MTPSAARLTATTPSASIVTLAELKSHLRVDFDDDDDLMDDLVEVAQGFVEGPSGIGQALGPSAWRLSLDDFPADGVISIPLQPVTAVTGVTWLDRAGDVQTLNLTALRIDLDARPARITPAVGGDWPDVQPATGAVKITFTAGPASPDPLLKRAVLMLAAHWYANPSVQGDGSPEVPLGVREILSRRAISWIG